MAGMMTNSENEKMPLKSPTPFSTYRWPVRQQQPLAARASFPSEPVFLWCIARQDRTPVASQVVR
jgi:hypothetical protein